MKVTLIAHTPDPEKVVAAAAKLCYSKSSIADLMDGLSDENVASFLDRLSSYGHQTPAEHASFTFGIEGVSRSFLAQMTRHRIASFSVQSQRYVDMSEADMVVPPAIAQDGEASEAFSQAIKSAKYAYDHLHHVLEDIHTYELMLGDSNMTEKHARAKASKMANEDARFVLPEACQTRMIVTMNARELNNFFKLRCCTRAAWEIRQVAEEMLKLVYPIAPHLFKDAGPGCLAGKGCTEGSMTCGLMPQVQDKYKNIKEALI